MKRIALLLSFVIVAVTSGMAQTKYITRTAEIYFKSNGEIDDGVEATNAQVAAVLNGANGEMAFQVLIKAFKFKKALMEEHFNENYMESDQFPKATFSGQIENFEGIDLSAPRSHEVMVTGKMTIHGVTNEVSQEGSFEVLEDGSIRMKTHMLIPCADYGIEIPSVVADKIAKEIDVEILALLKPAS